MLSSLELSDCSAGGGKNSESGELRLGLPLSDGKVRPKFRGGSDALTGLVYLLLFTRRE